MSVFEKIKTKIEAASIEYQTQEHPNEPLASEKAMGFEPDASPHHEGAKAICVKGKKSKAFTLFVLPDDLRLDQKKVKAILGERWSFASHDEVIEVTKCIPGSVPPFGSVLGLRAIVDDTFYKDKDIFFNAGSLTNSVRMSYEDYLKVEQPEVMSTTEPKE
ncbi:MAG: YbaK/EbsC family protein [bacterium]|jgi:Ala-tRNA(Pro) deacylase|nr:YbaK/EbsC family protein [bacterium]